MKAGTVHAPTPNGDFCRYVMIGQPGWDDMNNVVEIVTKEGVKIAAPKTSQRETLDTALGNKKGTQLLLNPLKP